MSRGRIVLGALLAIAACGEDPRSAPGANAGSADGLGASAVELAHFPLAENDVPAGRDATYDAGVSQDGGGSLRIETQAGGRLRLYELDDVGPIHGRLVYTGFLRSRDLDGTAFLELWCRPAEGDPAFVRGIQTAVSGTFDWRPQVIGFSNPDLCKGPVSVELNVVIQGSGTVWIDNLRLWSVPVE